MSMIDIAQAETSDCIKRATYPIIESGHQDQILLYYLLVFCGMVIATVTI
jgi:hypothetical protein